MKTVDFFTGRTPSVYAALVVIKIIITLNALLIFYLDDTTGIDFPGIRKLARLRIARAILCFGFTFGAIFHLMTEACRMYERKHTSYFWAAAFGLFFETVSMVALMGLVGFGVPAYQYMQSYFLYIYLISYCIFLIIDTIITIGQFISSKASLNLILVRILTCLVAILTAAITIFDDFTKVVFLNGAASTISQWIFILIQIFYTWSISRRYFPKVQQLLKPEHPTVLPILSLTTLVAIILAYFLSTQVNFSLIDFPYISECLAEDLPSGIMMCLGFFGSYYSILTVAFRFVQLFKDDFYTKTNIAAYVFGLLTITGSIIVYSFDMNINTIIHHFGAFLIFFSATVYCILQTFLSFKYYYSVGELKFLIVAIFRAVLMTIVVISGLLTMVFTLLNLLMPHGPRYIKVVASFNEWLELTTTQVFIASFVVDFSTKYTENDEE